MIYMHFWYLSKHVIYVSRPVFHWESNGDNIKASQSFFHNSEDYPEAWHNIRLRWILSKAL